MRVRIGSALGVMLLGAAGGPDAAAQRATGAALPPACPGPTASVSLQEAATDSSPWRWVVTYNGPAAGGGCTMVRVIQRPLPPPPPADSIPACLLPIRRDPLMTHDIIDIRRIVQPAPGTGPVDDCKRHEERGLAATARDDAGCWWLDADLHVQRFVPMPPACTPGAIAGTCDSNVSNNDGSTSAPSPGNAVTEGSRFGEPLGTMHVGDKPTPERLANVHVRVQLKEQNTSNRVLARATAPVDQSVVNFPMGAPCP